MNRLALVTSLAVAVAFVGTQFPAREAPASAVMLAGTPMPLESAIIEIQEGPGATTPTPSPTPKPVRKGGKGKAAPAATNAATEAPTPPNPTPSPPATSAAVEPPPTTIPTQRPTPRPIAPYQPTVPQSLEDPNVQGILHRAIPQLSSFGWLTGTWRAHNVEELGDGRQRDLGSNTYVFAPTMKGRWIFGGDGKASDYFYITYDPFAEHWSLVRLNSNPSYGIWISDRGWHGNAIEFTSSYSYANGRQYHRRITIIHKDARTFGIYDEEQLPDGSWTGDDEVELTKQE